MVDVWLPYGKTEVHARVTSENLMEIVGVREGSGIKDASQEIENTVKETTFPEGLAEVAKSGGKIVLVLNVPDIFLAKLAASSVMRLAEKTCTKSCDLTVLLTNNPFAPKASSVIDPLKEEISSLGANVVTHNPLNDNIYVCDTQSGVKVYLSRAFYEADAKIVVSTVEPNPYILYNCCESGIAFGLTSLETIKGILTPILDAGDLQERAFREAIEISKIAKVDFSIGIVRNFRGEVTKCFAGSPEDTLHKSVDLADSLYRVTFGKEPDIVVISPGGAPFDDDVLSACGCLENAIKVVKRNGIIILVAECSEGYGGTCFRQVIRRVKGDLTQLERILESDFSVDGFISYRFLRALKRASILMVSAIPNYYVSEIPGLKVFRTLNDALNYALSKLGTKAKIAVIPHGNHIILTNKE
ncbi:MAG: lactate racemase domain-containing protein [Candidatus Bathyarchaeia archaeon]